MGNRDEPREYAAGRPTFEGYLEDEEELERKLAEKRRQARLKRRIIRGVVAALLTIVGGALAVYLGDVMWSWWPL